MFVKLRCLLLLFTKWKRVCTTPHPPDYSSLESNTSQWQEQSMQPNSLPFPHPANCHNITMCSLILCQMLSPKAYKPACMYVCMFFQKQVNIFHTHQPLSLYASGMSGLIMTVLLKEAERERPPKSDSLAPLMATMGCPEPSKFSACIQK